MYAHCVQGGGGGGEGVKMAKMLHTYYMDAPIYIVVLFITFSLLVYTSLNRVLDLYIVIISNTFTYTAFDMISDLFY